MNTAFAEFYAHPRFTGFVLERSVPDVLGLGELGEDPLHLVAGPATAAEALRAHAPRLTVAEFDPDRTAEVAERLAGDPAVEVVGVDPEHLPFDDDRFSAATVFFSLMHVPGSDAQDRVLAELARVLRPGGSLLGTYMLDGPQFRELNAGGDAVPIDAMTWDDRLTRAGFTVEAHDVWRYPRFAATARPR